MSATMLTSSQPEQTSGAQGPTEAISAQPPKPESLPRDPAPGSQTLRVLVAGDVIPHRPALIAPESLKSSLLPLAPLFAKADTVIANYEAATGEVDKKAFRLAYAAPPEWLSALPETGIKAVTVANNHACDLDYDGVETTLETARKANITALGGDLKSDPWQPRTIAEKNDKRVCAIAWTTFLNAPGGCSRTTRLAIASENAEGRKKVAAAIARARASGCDATIAILHGGEEYVRQTPAIMNVARQAAESGADAVVVHHPHVASPVVVHTTKDGRKTPIFASVGNLVSNQGESWKPPMFPVLRQNRRLVCVNGWTRLGVLADLSFDFAAADGPRLDWSFHLLWTDNQHAEDKSPMPKIDTRLLDADKDAEVIARLTDDEAGPIDLFDDPCWVEHPNYTDADREHGKSDPRCETTLVRSTRTNEFAHREPTGGPSARAARKTSRPPKPSKQTKTRP